MRVATNALTWTKFQFNSMAFPNVAEEDKVQLLAELSPVFFDCVFDLEDESYFRFPVPSPIFVWLSYDFISIQIIWLERETDYPSPSSS